MKNILLYLVFFLSALAAQTENSGKDSLELIFSEKLQQKLDSLKADFDLQKQKLETKFNAEREQYSKRIQLLADSLNSIPISEPTPQKAPLEQQSQSINKNEETLLFQYLIALKSVETKKTSFLKILASPDENLTVYKLSEMDIYLQKFFPDARCENIQSYIIDLTLENKLYHRAEMELIKYAYLYIDKSNYSLTMEKYLTDFNRIKFFSERMQFINDTVNKILTNTPLIERYFNFISLLNSYPENEIREFFLREAELFLIRFSDDSFNPKILFQLAEYYRIKGEQQKAFLSAEKIMKIYPGATVYSDALYLQGSIEFNEFKEYQEAAETFTDFINAFPDHSKAQTSLFNIAKIYDEHLKEYDKAINQYKTYADKYPLSPEAITGLNRSAEIYYKELKALQSSVDTYLLIEQKYTNSAFGKHALYNAGLLYEEKKYYKNAVVQFSEVYRKYPGSDLALLSLEKSALIYLEKLNDTENGKSVLSKIVEQFPGSKSAKEAIERMSSIQSEEMIEAPQNEE
ncbi:MAG: tetratricopeptide repeat protein [Candidatus Marinimicrobia bacterium]|nr:tetratricopeptide repeat protein [Candidatus Neomarinimicrobiota bacterium]